MSNAESSRSSSVLVLGSSDTGKTHYIIQLFGRLRTHAAMLKLRAAPGSFAAFEAALTRLNQGLPATHTATTAFDELRLPLFTQEGTALDFVVPDYGGEQVRAMMDERRIGVAWGERVRAASGWLIFIRLGRLSEDRDIVSRPVDKMLTPQPSEMPCAPSQWSEQSRFVEFLQLLLYARGVGIGARLSAPPLGIVLSCWDELSQSEQKQKPEQVLHSRLPLFSDFLEANWLPEARFVIGLSSLERPLDDKKPDEDFINQGPEHFGYVIDPAGNHTRDLTVPLVQILERAR